LLCTGDLHIGRRSSKVPDGVEGGFSCGEAWERIVHLAVLERVDAVFLSGDVIDRDNRFYQALGPLERGLRKLQAAHIPVFSVTGNHDYASLLQISQTLEGLIRVVGPNGAWEVLESGPLRIVGWSYQSERQATSPLIHLRLDRTGVPTVGLLHADLDNRASIYGPVLAAELTRMPVDLWLLGHIHRPYVRETKEATILNPGSPQAMDPGEAGLHGPWIVEVAPGERPKLRQIPLSNVWYETLEIPLDAVPEEEILGHLSGAVLARRGTVLAASPDLRLLSLRIRLTGRSATPLARIAKIVSDQDWAGTFTGSLHVAVETISTEGVRPARDMELLAQGRTPVALLAQALLGIERGDPAQDDLVASMRREVERVGTFSAYQEIAEEAPPAEAQVRAWALDAGYRLLDRLVEQGAAA